MGRILPTANRLLLAFTALAMPVTAAAEDPAAPEETVVATPIKLVISEVTADTTVLPEDKILELFSLYREARSTGMLDEANVLAKRIVEMSITSYGVQSRQTAEALTNLGELQAGNGDYKAAMLNLAHAIEIIEILDDYLSEDLLIPLNAMGDVQRRVGALDLAIDSWNRALHITHVNQGPHNYEQIETLISLGRLYAGAGESKKARRISRRIEFLRSREYEAEFRLE